MQNDTVSFTETKSNATASTTLAIKDNKTLKAVRALDEAQAKAAQAKEAYIATLPLATAEQVAYEAELVRSVRVSDADKSGINKAYRLDEIQRLQIATAKAEHRREINTADGRKLAAQTVAKAKTLTSFKLKQGKKGITFAMAGAL